MLGIGSQVLRRVRLAIRSLGDRSVEQAKSANSEKTPPTPEFMQLFKSVVAAHADEMRLTETGELAGFYNPPDKPVLKRIAKVLADAGEFQKQPNLVQGSAYKAIESAILGLSQEKAEQLDLKNVLPPPHIHMMARQRGVFFDLRNADIVVATLERAQIGLKPQSHYMDFGCSSGRTVRTLDRAFPASFWHGVDPVSESIEFARMAVPRAAFRVSPQSPPLPYSDETFDGVIGLSIWSHFSAEAGRAWLKEVRRVVRPGGFVLFTTHGYTDVATRISKMKHSKNMLDTVIEAMSNEGFYFKNDIKQGHRGLETRNWGTAFVTRTWVEANYVTKGWKLAHCEFGRWGNRQDLYVLRAV